MKDHKIKKQNANFSSQNAEIVQQALFSWKLFSSEGTKYLAQSL
jgi:hypothetical protein